MQAIRQFQNAQKEFTGFNSGIENQQFNLYKINVRIFIKQVQQEFTRIINQHHHEKKILLQQIQKLKQQLLSKNQFRSSVFSPIKTVFINNYRQVFEKKQNKLLTDLNKPLQNDKNLNLNQIHRGIIATQFSPKLTKLHTFESIQQKQCQKFIQQTSNFSQNLSSLSSFSKDLIKKHKMKNIKKKNNEKQEKKNGENKENRENKEKHQNSVNKIKYNLEMTNLLKNVRQQMTERISRTVQKNIIKKEDNIKSLGKKKPFLHNVQITKDFFSLVLE